MKPLDPTGLKRLHRDWRRRTEGRLAIALDSVQSPYNVGAIVRTAAAYRAEYVWLTGSTPHPRTPPVQKTALGTDRFVQVETVDNPVARARADEFRVVAIELTDDARPLHTLSFTGALCLVVGNEDHGISKAVLSTCDEIAYLPQIGKVGSLNVATAASIAMYEVRRQEWDTEINE